MAGGFVDIIVNMPGVPELLRETLIALAIGALIGLERENTEEKKYAGLRTLTLLCGAGPLAVYISEVMGSVFAVATYLVLSAALSMTIVFIRLYVEGENIGLTTSVAVFMVGILGVLVGYRMYLEAIAIGIIVAFLLAEKATFSRHVQALSKEEMTDALKLGMLVFILLPILPEGTVGPYGGINLSKILVLVIFVLLIEFLAYFLMRQFGRSRGIPLTGFLGGGASSFATAGVMARLAEKDVSMLKTASSGVFLAITAMVVRNVGIAGAFIAGEKGLMSFLGMKLLIFPSLIIVVLSLAYAFLNRDGGSAEDLDVGIESPFSFRSALKFGSIFLVVSVFSNMANYFFGNPGLYTASFISGMASSAAVVTTAVSLLAAGTINLETSAAMVSLSIIASTISKIMVVGIISKRMRRNVVVPMLIIVVLASLSVFI